VKVKCGCRIETCKVSYLDIHNNSCPYDPVILRICLDSGENCSFYLARETSPKLYDVLMEMLEEQDER